MNKECICNKHAILRVSDIATTMPETQRRNKMNRNEYFAIVISKDGITTMPTSPPDNAWRAIDILAKELEASGMAPDEALKKAHKIVHEKNEPND